MSLRQLGQRMSITPQSVKEIEEREKKGTISIKVLKQTAAALNMRFVYGFIPSEKTLEGMIEKRAEELARSIVERASTQMGLELEYIKGQTPLEEDEIVIRFKHRLVKIHPFPNGNGRHSRLCADILI
jgi:predicted DNA-binding mobile mystery protein A